RHALDHRAGAPERVPLGGDEALRQHPPHVGRERVGHGLDRAPAERRLDGLTHADPELALEPRALHLGARIHWNRTGEQRLTWNAPAASTEERRPCPCPTPSRTTSRPSAPGTAPGRSAGGTRAGPTSPSPARERCSRSPSRCAPSTTSPRGS